MFRKTVFWIHLVAGAIAGLVIAVMSVTGVALAFEKELVAWSEADARIVAAPDGAAASRLPADELLKNFRAAWPGLKPSTLTESADPQLAVAIGVGRDAVYYANPYTGEVRAPKSTRMRELLRTMENAHRWLALEGTARPTGRLITGVCNAAFFVLGVSGLYLWWPRNFSGRVLKPSLWFVKGAKGKARDWNWHNVFGFWSLPILLVLTATGVVMSFRWANNLVYRLAGEQPPAAAAPNRPGPQAAQGSRSGQGAQLANPSGQRRGAQNGLSGQGGPAGPATAAGAVGTAEMIAPPDELSRAAGFEALLASVRTAKPGWESISLRLPAESVGRGAGASGRGVEASSAAGRPAVTATVRTSRAWPLFASTSVTLDPYTAEVLKSSDFSDATTGRRARLWIRFLHTGEALGTIGKLVAGLASTAGVMLVWTGFALALRRAAAYRRRRRAAHA